MGSVKRTLALVVTGIVLLGLSGCRRASNSDTGDAGTGSVAETITLTDGTTRSFHTHRPTSLAGGTTTAPLLVALHGGLGSGTQFEANSGFDAIADREGFVVVYPDGTDVPVTRNGKVWNGGTCCSVADDRHRGVDDVAYLRQLVELFVRERHADPARIYVTGHSNGAIMAMRLACEAADVVNAIAVQAGTLAVDGCAPTRPVSVFELHGTADRNIPIDGGTGDRSVSQTDFASPRRTMERFAALNRCDPTPSTATDPTNPDVTTRTWSGCAGAVTVAMAEVTGAGHAWMGHPSTTRLGGLLVGAPYDRLDASETMWRALTR